MGRLLARSNPRGRRCAVPSCTNRLNEQTASTSSPTFSTIPEDPAVRDEFRSVLGISRILKDAVICFDHFLPGDYAEDGTLLPSARPSRDVGSASIPSIESTSISPSRSSPTKKRQGSICAVLGCNKYAGDRRREALHFFKCPVKPGPDTPQEQKDMYNKWFDACARLDLIEFAPHHRVCSRHFLPDEIDEHSHTCRTRLKAGVWPTRFLTKPLKKSGPLVKEKRKNVIAQLERDAPDEMDAANPGESIVVVNKPMVIVMPTTLPVIPRLEDSYSMTISDQSGQNDVWNSITAEGFQPPFPADGGGTWSVIKRQSDHIIFARIRPTAFSSTLMYSTAVDFVRVNKDLSVILSSGNRSIPTQVVSTYFTSAAYHNANETAPAVLSPFLYDFAKYDGMIFAKP